MSPTLFNIMINCVFSGTEKDLGISLFACRNRNYVVEKVQKGIDDVQEWGNKQGLFRLFSVETIKGMMFTKVSGARSLQITWYP